MSQQAYQQQESVQQRYRRILNRATSTTDRAFYWDGLYYQDLQPAQLPQQYHSSLNSSQSPTDVQTFGSLPTYSISQSQPYMDDSNLAVYEELVTGFIHQQNDAPSTWPSLTTHPQQRQSHVIRRQQQGKPDISDFNILLKSGVAKITDFGLSGQMMSSSSGEGTAAYRDPLSFRNQSYKRGKKSDIFSLGVLFWEISSGQIPCKNWTSIVIAECRKQGYRDPPLPETPEAFVQLYSACWSENPEERPSCKEIHKQLKLLLDDEDQHLLLPGKY
ncbi:1799_t:CDS:2 [Paraglomus occultum]|uniref:1799_t:CDS:1 n=1 Tax=Paraglomus occultum TaxID=144539 RepID=A0A9N9G7Z0_9GLOM|nr:1799_t:CDS:2 [Paraglomus occultum]